jgi:hypothetical protein
MNEAVRLRAQKTYSTDPEFLEQMALEEEARHVRATGEEVGGRSRTGGVGTAGAVYISNHRLRRHRGSRAIAEYETAPRARRASMVTVLLCRVIRQ